jgi:hypothetical protein
VYLYDETVRGPDTYEDTNPTTTPVTTGEPVTSSEAWNPNPT